MKSSTVIGDSLCSLPPSLTTTSGGTIESRSRKLVLVLVSVMVSCCPQTKMTCTGVSRYKSVLTYLCAQSKGTLTAGGFVAHVEHLARGAQGRVRIGIELD